MAADEVFKVGDTVMYSSRFLKSIAMNDARIANCRGTVMDVYHLKHGPVLVKIDWQDGRTGSVNQQNLIAAKDLHKERV